MYLSAIDFNTKCADKLIHALELIKDKIINNKEYLISIKLL